jgi:hypothetical protein
MHWHIAAHPCAAGSCHGFHPRTRVAPRWFEPQRDVDGGRRASLE